MYAMADLSQERLEASNSVADVEGDVRMPTHVDRRIVLFDLGERGFASNLASQPQIAGNRFSLGPLVVS